MTPKRYKKTMKMLFAIMAACIFAQIVLQVGIIAGWWNQ